MSLFNTRISGTCEKTGKSCDPSCECMNCQEYRASIRMSDKTQILFCRTFTYWCTRRNAWIGEKEYTHARTIEEARLTFYRSEDESTTIRRLKDVQVARAIGMFVTDKYGLELSAD